MPLEFLEFWAESVWWMLVDSAFYFLLGLVLAGGVWAWLNESRLSRLLGGSPSRVIFRSALIGVPLPLCSCSVLPVAKQLRNSGLSRAGTAAFLVSTPETGVDSILLTYSLTDPLLTVARPVTAFITAMAVGTIEQSFGSDSEEARVIPLESAEPAACCDDGCAQPTPPDSGSHRSRLFDGLKHSFTTLIADLGPYLFIGYLLAGLVAALLGPDPQQWMGDLIAGWLPYVAAIVVGLPLYICATSSTPLAAVLLASGFPPGAILVFLLVGPATNLASLAVLKQILGGLATLRYVVVIVVTSVLCGLAVDQLYDTLAVVASYSAGGSMEHRGWLHMFSAIVLSALILWHSARWLKSKLS